jgi:hypothetical protein
VLASYYTVFLSIAYASFLAVAGLLSSTYLSRMSSSVSMASSRIVSNTGFGFGMVVNVVICVCGVVFPFPPAVWSILSCLIIFTHSEVPSRSSKFLILLRTPST